MVSLCARRGDSLSQSSVYFQRPYKQLLLFSHSLLLALSLSLSAKRRSFWHWPDKFLTLNIEVRESLGAKFALKF
ncbi:hypothetical protein LWI29_027912 [Acer saccharum]|uniref:Uncharacterized protein n=1 Tax=Acer saccharum TaxID=4024 RepID=A0AA39S6I6_ACESA|nr:hypothetical protein LWI29_027912 [Acer saccharum]